MTATTPRIPPQNPSLVRPAHVLAETLVDDDTLTISHYPGQSDRVVVTFNSAGFSLWRDQPDEFIGLARGNRRNHVIAVTDRRRSWYSTPGLQKRITSTLKTHIAGLDVARITTLGSSMGGHGALLFAERIGAETAIAFVPQFTMHSRIKEPRWTEMRGSLVDENLGTLRPRLTGATRAYCLFGARDKLDLKHLRWISRNCTVTSFLLDGFTHELPRELKGRHILEGVVGALLDEDMPRLDALLGPMLVDDPRSGPDGAGQRSGPGGGAAT